MTSADNPWLRIPAADYEGHMEAVGLLEYVDPAALFRRFHDWVTPWGRISIILQEEIPGIAPVSTTRYESLQTLAGTMSLRSAEQIAAIGAEGGLVLESRRALELPSGKILVLMLFERASARAVRNTRSAPAQRE